MRNILLIISAFLLQDCKSKVMMSNMLGTEIDVKKYLERGYKPIYCNQKIIKLVYLKGKKSIADEKYILKALQDWLTKNHLSMEVDTFDILSRTNYLYTYFIAYEPVDVFKTELNIDG